VTLPVSASRPPSARMPRRRGCCCGFAAAPLVITAVTRCRTAALLLSKSTNCLGRGVRIVVSVTLIWFPRRSTALLASARVILMTKLPLAPGVRAWTRTFVVPPVPSLKVMFAVPNVTPTGWISPTQPYSSLLTSAEPSA